MPRESLKEDLKILAELKLEVKSKAALLGMEKPGSVDENKEIKMEREVSSIVSLVSPPLTQFDPACFGALASQINSFKGRRRTRHGEPTLFLRLVLLVEGGRR